MLGFVTSLPHPVNCVSYDRRCRLLGDTLRSILAQRDQDLCVRVVANEPPIARYLPSDDRVEIVLVDFPAPNKPEHTPVATNAMYADKGGKLSVGTAAARRAGAGYIMWVDSDDFVSNRLSEFVHAHDGETGWYSDAGYFHVAGSRTVRPLEHEFHQRNGSTHILRADITGVPPTVEPSMTRTAVIDAVGQRRVRSIMGDHKWIVAFFAELGTPLAPLPFPSAVWEIGTGENYSRVLTASGARRPVAGPISEEYGLPVPGRPEAVRTAVVGARARASPGGSAAVGNRSKSCRARIENPADEAARPAPG